jgi:nitroimidazol reductase NimA-like FMN-containing flavoprotein (pyridoxamine 5'-phosphate oxidase superfamily)
MFTVDQRNKVRRLPERGCYEHADIYEVLDEGLLAHVAFVVDQQPFVIPMNYARDGDSLLLHGSVASRLLKNLSTGIPVSACITLLDALVLARSVFHHSMNYRSVVVFGTARLVDDPQEKDTALDLMVEHLVPGRTGHARAPGRKELGATRVLRLDIEQASLKQRSGPPGDAAGDLDNGSWAGLIPLSMAIGEPVPDEGSQQQPVPDHVRNYRR